ncbi:PadR family transcriptional regulator [Agromyces archimandritae]|uniref:PadR family transcriptional regulator n=1 Tax=Agromyces archimandritae TaxID=2781962 RepID=A0A975FNF7_9MICO|nr:PadR family transcriptional regulator [Agromyces archimandritae]
MDEDLTAGHLQELRRGTVVLGCLLRLADADYGYALLESLGDAGIVVDANTLYPLLRRLEKQGLLTSEWNTEEARPRKFYRTSPAGADIAARLLDEWRRLDRAVEGLAAADGEAPASAPTPTDPAGDAGTDSDTGSQQ